MKTSDQTNELFAAIARAQSEFPAIPKNQEVEVKKDGRSLYKFKYADLTQIIDSTRPCLTKNGISFTQSMVRDDLLGMGFVTRLMHSSGQWCETGFVPAVLSERSGMKDVAGVTTYGKRLSLSQALGVSADEDIDAPPEQGEQIEKKANLKESGDSNLNQSVSEKQLSRMFAIMKKKELKNDEIRAVCKEIYGVDSSKNLTRIQYDELTGKMDMLSRDAFFIWYLEKKEELGL